MPLVMWLKRSTFSLSVLTLPHEVIPELVTEPLPSSFFQPCSSVPMQSVVVDDILCLAPSSPPWLGISSTISSSSIGLADYPDPQAHDGWSLSLMLNKFLKMALPISPTHDAAKDNEEEGHTDSGWE
ncbi:hypothetical protein KI387_036849, partial [Taxus chinensis]